MKPKLIALLKQHYPNFEPRQLYHSGRMWYVEGDDFVTPLGETLAIAVRRVEAMIREKKGHRYFQGWR